MEKYSEYKDSGVKWIGDIPAHWEVKRLGLFFTENKTINSCMQCTEAYKFNYGTLIRKDEDIDPNELKDTYNKYTILKPRDIVINGLNLNYDFVSQRVALATSTGIITSAYIVLSPRTRVHELFFYYLLKSMDGMKLFHGMGTGIRLTLSFKDLKYQLLPIPPLAEQHAIVSYLDSKVGQIDTYIAKQTQQIELLKELKQAVIANAVTKGIDTNPNVKRKQSGVNWLGEIPEHWEVSKLRKHFIPRIQKVSDKDYAPLSVTKDGILPQLDTACKTDNGENRKLVRKGDYVVNSRSDRKGSGGISPFDGSVSLINIVIYPIDGEQEYFHYLFRSNNFVEEFYRNGRGIVADLWTTRYQEMKNIEIPFPPLSEQRAIASYIEAQTANIDKLIDAYQQQVERIKEYKQRLITDAVTGKINVTGKQTQTN